MFVHVGKGTEAGHGRVFQLAHTECLFGSTTDFEKPAAQATPVQASSGDVTTPPVHAIVVAYHAADHLDRCLASLEQEVPVMVVDNSSSSDVRAVADSHAATYVDPGVNLGFGAGVNLALRGLEADAPDAVLLLNPDAILTPRDLRALVGHLSRPGNERVAAVSPRLVSPDGTEQRVVWPFPTPWRAWTDAVGLRGLAARRTYVIGAVLVLRSKTLRDIGLFDERFFLYAEDADWQRRASDEDWKAGVCMDAVAVHLGGGSSDDARRQELLFHAAHETYIRKWHGRLGWLIYRSAAVLGAVARMVIFAGERRSLAAWRALIYVRGPRRCAGLTRE